MCIRDSSKEDQDSCFFKAVAVAKQILENQIDSEMCIRDRCYTTYKGRRLAA